MKTVVFVDELLLVNFAAAAALLLGAGLLCGRSCTGLRLCAGSAAAAVSTLVLLAPPWPAPLAVLYKIVSCCGVVAVCYGVAGVRSFARLCGWYAALNGLLCGAVVLPGVQANNLSVLLPVRPGQLLLCCAGVYGLLRGLLAVFGRPQRGCFAAVLQIAGGNSAGTGLPRHRLYPARPPCRAAGGAGAVPASAQPAARTAARLLRQLVCRRRCPASGAEGAVCTLRRRYRPLPAARRARRAVPWAAPRARPAGGLLRPGRPHRRMDAAVGGRRGGGGGGVGVFRPLRRSRASSPGGRAYSIAVIFYYSSDTFPSWQKSSPFGGAGTA